MEEDIIEGSIKMHRANDSILIYEGEFTISAATEIYIVNGTINYDWFPSVGVKFRGDIITSKNKNFDLKQLESLLDKNFDLIVKNVKWGSLKITRIRTSLLSNAAILIGGRIEDLVTNDRSIAVSKIRFAVPNLTRYFGSPVVKQDTGRLLTQASRLTLQDDKHLIIIDLCYDHHRRSSSLLDSGGFDILAYGELKKIKGDLKLSEINDPVLCLNKFLTFLNGRRTSILFLEGIYNDEPLWHSYQHNLTESYKTVHKWLDPIHTNNIDLLWKNFTRLWNIDKSFLQSAIHWYSEANGNSGLADGSLIMAQTNLELLYNWWIVEEKKLILGKDSESISASNKIRLLISNLGISTDCPPKFKTVSQFINNDKQVQDCPEAVVQIRNAIVHSQSEKRIKLEKIGHEAVGEALHICLWYIELVLLKILQFNGKYADRSSLNTWEAKLVPWSNE